MAHVHLILPMAPHRITEIVFQNGYTYVNVVLSDGTPKTFKQPGRRYG